MNFENRVLLISMTVMFLGISIVILLLKQPDSKYLRPFLLPKSIDPDNEFGRLLSWIVAVVFILVGSFVMITTLYEIVLGPSTN